MIRKRRHRGGSSGSRTSSSCCPGHIVVAGPEQLRQDDAAAGDRGVEPGAEPLEGAATISSSTAAPTRGRRSRARLLARCRCARLICCGASGRYTGPIEIAVEHRRLALTMEF